MILTIPGGASQTWGSEILLNVSEITYPEDAVNPQLYYQVRIKATLEGVLVREAALLPDVDGNASTDIAPYITSPGTIDIEWGEKYRDINGWVMNWFTEDPRSIEIVNETEIVNGSMTIPGGAVQLSGNPIQIIVTTTEEAMANKTNYKLALKVTCTTLQDVALAWSPSVEEIAPNNLESVFDISGLVDYQIAHSFSYPSVAAAIPHDLLAIKATIDIGETWTDADGVRQESWQNLDSDNVLRILQGKLRQYELATLNDAGKNFATEHIAGGKFLTHLPNSQRIGPNHIPMLWYLGRWTDDHAITANLSFTTNDKVGHIPRTEDIVLYSITGLMEFAFQPQHWGYDPAPGILIDSFEFWLTDANGEISEHRTYLVDNGYYEKSFTFYYVNPLSGVDLIWMTGEHSEGLKTESETAYRPVPAGSGTKVSGLKTISIKGQRTWELNTGPHTRAEMLALRDFLEAKERWMVDPDNSAKLIPVYIESGDFSLYSSMEDILSLEVKIMEAH